MRQDILQVIMAFFGTMGFSVMFNIKRSKLVVVSLGGALTWSVFLVVRWYMESEIGGLFLAAVFASLLSEVLARILKTPVIILLVPMLIPLIPGGDLYYTMNEIVRGNVTEFGSNARWVLQEAGAIAFGIIVITSLMQIIMKVKKLRL